VQIFVVLMEYVNFGHIGENIATLRRQIQGRCLYLMQFLETRTVEQVVNVKLIMIIMDMIYLASQG